MAKPTVSVSVLVTGLLFSAVFCGCRAGPSAASAVEALAHNRYLIGSPAAWRPLDVEQEVLDRSMAARRQAAWASVEQALSPVVLHNPLTGMPLRDGHSGELLTVPAWQTWYELSEFKAMFTELYWQRLTPGERQAGVATEAEVEGELAEFPLKPLEARWLASAPGDQESRFLRLLSQITDPERARSVNGVSGQGYTLFSPALVAHYLRHFTAVAGCTGATTRTQEEQDASCFGAPFPPGAVAVKATWSPVHGGVAKFDTSARGLAKLLLQDHGTWQAAPQLLYPTSSQIYTASSFVDSREAQSFALLGLHIITKDVPRWLWTTLWWSEAPDSDFGEDRPASLRASVWSHYKMCTVSTFAEGDEDLRAAGAAITGEALLASQDPSLKQALLAASHFGPATLCSNPYLEFQHGTGASNCIGCHQYSGPFASGTKPKPDRDQRRASFMADFLWSFEDTTEQFRGAIVEVMHTPPD